MNDLLEEVFKTQQFVNSRNELIAIHSETSKDQCEFLQKLIVENKFKSSLEIGLAYGLSTLAITESIADHGGSHLVIDKFQNTGWDGNGLDLIKKAGYEKYIDFREDYCYSVLPQLLAEGRKFDFVYIDSTKQFDWLLVDFFYLDKILSVHGIIVFDDVAFPGIRKLLRYIVQFPNYRVHSQFPVNKSHSGLRKFARVLKYLPYAQKILKENILVPDFALGINTRAVALIKVDEDKRNWNWHVPF